jgi:hypothetical protein
VYCYIWGSLDDHRALITLDEDGTRLTRIADRYGLHVHPVEGLVGPRLASEIEHPKRHVQLDLRGPSLVCPRAWPAVWVRYVLWVRFVNIHLYIRSCYAETATDTPWSSPLRAKIAPLETEGEVDPARETVR